MHGSCSEIKEELRMPKCRSVTCEARRGGPLEQDVGVELKWDEQTEQWVCEHCGYTDVSDK